MKFLGDDLCREWMAFDWFTKDALWELVGHLFGPESPECARCGFTLGPRDTSMLQEELINWPRYKRCEYFQVSPVDGDYSVLSRGGLTAESPINAEVVCPACHHASVAGISIPMGYGTLAQAPWISQDVLNVGYQFSLGLQGSKSLVYRRECRDFVQSFDTLPGHLATVFPVLTSIDTDFNGLDGHRERIRLFVEAARSTTGHETKEAWLYDGLRYVPIGSKFDSAGVSEYWLSRLEETEKAVGWAKVMENGVV